MVAAREIAGEESIAATRIGIAADIANRPLREPVAACVLQLLLVRRLNGAVRMALLGGQSQEMCGVNGGAATRRRRFCDGFLTRALRRRPSDGWECAEYI